MEEFLALIKDHINIIQDFLVRLQSTIGLSNSTDDSIYGKINNIDISLQNIKIPTYFVETLIIDTNHFICTHEPQNGVCLNNEITLYHPDGGTLIWEGITFIGNQGILDGAGMEYNGWQMKIQYFYI